VCFEFLRDMTHLCAWRDSFICFLSWNAGPSQSLNIRASRHAHLNKTWHTYEWVMAQVHESCHIWMSHRQPLFLDVGIHTLFVDFGMCHATHIRIRHVARKNESRPARLYESWHTYERIILRIWASWATHMNESCHAYEWVMSRIWMMEACHTYTNESWHTYERVMSHIWMSHVTHMNEWTYRTYTNESCHTYERVMPHK